MNKKGFALWGYAIMLSMTLIVLSLALAPSVQSFTSQAMSNSTADFIGLNCADDAQSNFIKGSCILVDFSMAYFIIGILLIALSILTARVVMK